MKTILHVLFVLAVVSIGQAGEVHGVPSGYPVDRYERTWVVNPFLKEVSKPPRPESPLKDFALTGIILRDTEQVVFLKNTVTQEFMRLTKAEPAKSGLSLLEVHPSSDRRQASVVVKLGEDTQTIRYLVESQKVAQPSHPPDSNSNLQTRRRLLLPQPK